MDEPVDAATLRTIVRAAIAAGNVSFAGHALTEMAKDGIGRDLALIVLRSGRYDGCDYERRSWRYRIAIPTIVVVVALESESAAVVVTAWRKT